jgi:hypothetical protein
MTGFQLQITVIARFGGFAEAAAKCLVAMIELADNAELLLNAAGEALMIL